MPFYDIGHPIRLFPAPSEPGFALDALQEPFIRLNVPYVVEPQTQPGILRLSCVPTGTYATIRIDDEAYIPEKDLQPYNVLPYGWLRYRRSPRGSSDEFHLVEIPDVRLQEILERAGKFLGDQMTCIQFYLSGGVFTWYSAYVLERRIIDMRFMQYAAVSKGLTRANFDAIVAMEMTQLTLPEVQ